MTQLDQQAGQRAWKPYERIFFNIALLYFFIQAFPLDWKFYRQLFSVNWLNPDYPSLFSLAHYTPRFFSGTYDYGEWAIVLGIAILGGLVWAVIERNRNRDYHSLYYWVRVIVRYRLAVALFAYGFIKLFPLLAPYPSISNLNTAYGDFNRWKLFSLSLGIVPSYEAFLGGVEIAFGLLLLFRKTASIAAFLIIVFTGNVFMSNVAYEGGEEAYSLYLVSLAIFILIYDLQRIVRLLILQKPTAPAFFRPRFAGWKRYGRWAVKAFIILFFVVVYGFKTNKALKENVYQFPRTPGLSNTAGLYNVSRFEINGQSVPYSLTDPVRWQDVVFEPWNTISIRSNRPVILDSTNIDRIHSDDQHRLYELEGTAGRHYYSYEADSIRNNLVLHNRNPHYAGETLQFSYERKDSTTIILHGIDQHGDSLFVTLDRIDKKYLLQEAQKTGRRAKLVL